jgi:hypothetical protein
VDEVQVDVREAQVRERLLERGAHERGRVLGVPELGGDEELRPRDLPRAVAHHGTEHLADLLLVAVARGAVDVAVARLERHPDGGAYLARRRLPRTQPQQRHLVPRVELHPRAARRCCCHFVGVGLCVPRAVFCLEDSR